MSRITVGAVAQAAVGNGRPLGMRRTVVGCDDCLAAPYSAGFCGPILIPIICLLLGLFRKKKGRIEVGLA